MFFLFIKLSITDILHESPLFENAKMIIDVRTITLGDFQVTWRTFKMFAKLMRQSVVYTNRVYSDIRSARRL